MVLKQGALEAYKEDYFKINTSPGSYGDSVRRNALNRYNKKTTEGSHKWNSKERRLAGHGLA